jgi:2-methylisocitrate lyase-like PEP mutase family enzyme
MIDTHQRGRAFRELHQQEGAFVIPNPWDAGSARLLASLGFLALATTSSGFAMSLGQHDGEPGREAVIAHGAQLVAATDLPVSADLENGFGHAPEDVAETIRRAGAAGLVGGSIEDFTGDRDNPLYPIEHAADRIRAAVEAARSLGFPFVLTARAENFFRGRPDLGDAIRRLQAYQEAGADVLFAPSLKTREQIATLVREVDRPVSVLVGKNLDLSVHELSTLGVRRISLGGMLSAVAYGALVHAAREILSTGTFGFAAELDRAKDLRTLIDAATAKG